jgi:hypothetical protein
MIYGVAIHYIVKKPLGKVLLKEDHAALINVIV